MPTPNLSSGPIVTPLIVSPLSVHFSKTHCTSLNVFNVTMHYSRWLFSLSFSISIELFIIVSSFSSISPGRPADNNAGVIVLLAVTHGMIDPHPFGGIFA